MGSLAEHPAMSDVLPATWRRSKPLKCNDFVCGGQLAFEQRTRRCAWVSAVRGMFRDWHLLREEMVGPIANVVNDPQDWDVYQQ